MEYVEHHIVLDNWQTMALHDVCQAMQVSRHLAILLVNKLANIHDRNRHNPECVNITCDGMQSMLVELTAFKSNCIFSKPEHSVVSAINLLI
jgi:hypothetical protein